MRRLVTVLVLAAAAACDCGGRDVPDAGSGGGSTAAGGGAAGGTAGGSAGGSAGGAAGGSTAGGAGGGLGGGTADAGSTALLPRLVVASHGASGGGTWSVRIWDHANTLTTDVAAPVTLANIDVPAVGLVASPFNLYVVHETTFASAAVVHRFDLPRILADNAPPSLTLTVNTVGATTGVNRVQLDAIGALWFERSPGEVLRFDRIASVLTGTPPSAIYRHPNDQVLGFAFEQTNNRLFGAQVSGSGVLVWNDANTKLGDAGRPDFTLASDDLQQLTIADGRLYGSFFGTDVKVWNSIGTASAPRAYNFALSLDGGAGSIRDQRVFNGHLVVTVQPTPTTGRVLIFKNIGITSANRAPDLVLDHASLVGAQKAVLGADGTLYVMDLNGVSIFTDALNTPVFATELQNGISLPADLLLIE